jgi:GNAT superfamily N-acetyltransferase
MRIRLAERVDAEQIAMILNKATLALQSKGIMQWSYPWSSEEINVEIAKKHAHVLLLEDAVVGTFFISSIDRIQDMKVELGSQYVSKIALLPAFQGRNLGAEILRFAVDYAHKCNRTLYLDCWAGNEKLRSFYSDHGLAYEGDFAEEDYYISVYHSS